MKPGIAFCVAGLLACALAPHLRAIPQEFGFVNFLGQPFEQFVLGMKEWGNQELPGEWEAAEAEGNEAQLLKARAKVFGIPAASLLAQRENGYLNAFRVTYDRQSAGDLRGKNQLYEQLLANIGLLAGTKPVVSGKARVYHLDALVIRAEPAEDDGAVVWFSRK